MSNSEPKISIQAVNADNWREVAKVSVSDAQTEFVATSTYYLALCCYSDWKPLAIYLGNKVIGFLMWGIDDDKSCWLALHDTCINQLVLLKQVRWKMTKLLLGSSWIKQVTLKIFSTATSI